MRLRLHLAPHLHQPACGIHQEAAALHAHVLLAVHGFLHPGAIGPGHRMVLVRGQREFQAEFPREFPRSAASCPGSPRSPSGPACRVAAAPPGCRRPAWCSRACPPSGRSTAGTAGPSAPSRLTVRPPLAGMLKAGAGAPSIGPASLIPRPRSQAADPPLEDRADRFGHLRHLCAQPGEVNRRPPALDCQQRRGCAAAPPRPAPAAPGRATCHGSAGPARSPSATAGRRGSCPTTMTSETFRDCADRAYGTYRKTALERLH